MKHLKLENRSAITFYAVLAAFSISILTHESEIQVLIHVGLFFPFLVYISRNFNHILHSRQEMIIQLSVLIQSGQFDLLICSLILFRVL